MKYLYIDADEDHVSLQYLDKKGDIKKPRSNTIMPRLVYVYEGITNDNGRNELIGKAHFGGIYEGSAEITRLWGEVYEYIENSYDIEYLEKIYINGDGAAWIKSGQKLIHKAKFVLDRFHMHKYIIGATSHLLDSVEDARREIYKAIYGEKKWLAEKTFEKILNVTEKGSKQKTVMAAREYILGNWSGIMQWVRDKNKEVYKACSLSLFRSRRAASLQHHQNPLSHANTILHGLMRPPAGISLSHTHTHTTHMFNTNMDTHTQPHICAHKPKCFNT